MEQIEFIKLSKNANIPQKATVGSAGYDLFAAHDALVEPMNRAIISTDIQLAMSKNIMGRIAPRSGLAFFNFIDIGGGIIDSDYRGPIKIILYNFNTQSFHVKRGDKIAQLIFATLPNTELIEVKTQNKTKRGGGGFGSTGDNFQE